jgi:streptogramin lyase
MKTSAAISAFILVTWSLAGLSVWTAEPIAAATIIDTVAGTGRAEDNGDRGPASEINIGQTFGVELGPDGALYICEVENHRIRRLDATTHEITTVAGNGSQGYAGDGGPATAASMNEPYEIRFDTDGNL